ncbi:MAG: phosphoadenosine phosphosulfate reductase family protein [Chloroflexota bacterium]
MPPPIYITSEIDQHLYQADVITLSVSGGKDSQAMTLAMITYIHDMMQTGWNGDVYLWHADLGRMAWPQSIHHCQQLANHIERRLVTYALKQDLLHTIDERIAKTKGHSAFPSAQARYCTSKHKRDAYNLYIRHTYPTDTVIINVMGFRDAESMSRKNRQPLTPRTKCTAITKKRWVYDYLPIKHYSEADVWETIGYSLDDINQIRQSYQDADPTTRKNLLTKHPNIHPAYIAGSDRCSCSCCIMASPNDLRVGANLNPTIYLNLVQREITTGYSYQPTRWLGDIAPHLLSEDMRQQLDAVKLKRSQQPTLL